MNLKADLRARLAADTAIAALVGNAVSWFEKNRADGYPCLILNTIEPGRDYTHEGPDGLDNPRIQFDCYGTTDVQADALALAVRDEMEGSGVWGGSRFGPGFLESENSFTEGEQDGGQRLYRVSLDFTFYHSAI
ncbi:MAG: DUF3168 domain-containing protein [Caulobacteraceae bacterium]|nr:DUF3168 domain-containing protein [Caulobacteraceae bacterium]